MATIRKRGGRYHVQIRKAGHAQITKSFPTKREATDYIRVVEGRLTTGELVVPGKQMLAEAVDVYIDHRNGPGRAARINKGAVVRPKLTKYELGVLDWWRTKLGNDRLAMLRPANFKKCRKELQALEISVATVNRRMSLVSAVISHAMEDGWCTVNPARIPALSEKETERVRLLSESEQEALMAACKESCEPCLVDFVMSAMGTGTRSGELRSLTWNAVDLDRGVAVLHWTKNKDKRVIPIRGKVLEIFKRRKKLWAAGKLTGEIDHQYVFWNRTGYAPFYYNKDWSLACKLSGVIDFRFHDLRHVAASHLAMAGVSLREIAEILGHRQLQMVMRYSHLYDEHVGSLGDKLDAALWGNK